MELAMKVHKQLPGGLPSEIWNYILGILDHADHSSLKSVLLCSSDMYKLAAPILFRTLYLECEGFNDESKWDERSKGRVHPIYLCVHVRAIIMVRPRRWFWGLRSTHFPRAFVECLYHLFKMAENLQDVCWWHGKYLPGEILYQLYKHRPQARVHIASSKVAVCEKINQKHTSAPHLSCIRSIEAEWCNGEYDEPIKSNATAHYPAQLKTILRRCRNLESLSLISKGDYRVPRGDVWDGLRNKEKEANTNTTSLVTFKEGDSLPQVKNLRLDGMRFGPLQSELWATQLPWQNIKYLSLLHFNWTSLLPKLTKEGCFHALETLEASTPLLYYPERDPSTNVNCISQFHAFLGILPPLKMFIGYGFPQETLAVLAVHHSKSLKDLRFRHQLKIGSKYPKENHTLRASIQDFDNLSTLFPSLRSLGLRVDWTPDEELPYDLIANIVLQSRIRHLELNLPDLRYSNDRHRSESWPYPGANEDACQALIQSLDEITTSLLSLNIVISDWYPYRSELWMRWLLEAFVIGERDHAGRMRFRKIRRFQHQGRPIHEGDFEPHVPPWVSKGIWPSDLRQDIEGRISDMFCGKMVREKISHP